MDLSTFKPGERVIAIHHPNTGEPMGLSITVVSADDPYVRAVDRKYAQELMVAAKSGRAMSASQVEARGIEKLAAAVKGWEWSGDLKWKGKKPAFDKATVTEVLTELDWLRRIVDQEVHDMGAFLPGSQSASPSASG